ncbi:hypothetical protein BDW60DRAFT_65889 [Aspergillus nidulans var. acristatus]
MGLREPHAIPSRRYPFLYHEGTSSAGVLGIHTQRPTCFEGSRPWLDYRRSTSTPIFPYCSPFSSAAFLYAFFSISLFHFFSFSHFFLSLFISCLSFPFPLFILCRLSLYYTGSPVYMYFPSIRHNVPNDGGRG